MDCEALDVLMEYQQDLKRYVASLHEVAAGLLAPRPGSGRVPPSNLKAKILAGLGQPLPPMEPAALVVTTAEGHVEWFNESFTAMCGYSLAELRGRKPGQVLQGPETDRAAVERIRVALRARRACREQLVNYHKDGTAYRADVQIMPVLDDDGQPLWFVAKERLLRGEAMRAGQS
jgi:PAS domain S-box-containing protein